MAAAMVDGVVPGHRGGAKAGRRESQIVALATARLYEMGSDCVEAINSISGERCSPHPHNFTDRLIRPGDQAFFDVIQSFMGYRTCYYRTFSVGAPPRRSAPPTARRASGWTRPSTCCSPGIGSDKIAKAFPRRKEIGFASEMDAFGLNFCHGLRPRPARAPGDQPAQLASRSRSSSRSAWCSRWRPIARRATACRRRASRRR